MSFKLKLILIFVFLMKSYECLNFCDAFVDNNYKISYGFRRLTESGNHSFVFIDQNYWKLGFTDNTDDDNKTVEIFADEGKTSNWFGSQYSMAFCVWFTNKCMAGLVKSDKKGIDWGELTDSETDLNLKGNTTFRSLDPKVGLAQMAFVPNWLERDKTFVVFVEQNSLKNYVKDNYVFEIDANLSGTQFTDYNFNLLYWHNQKQAIESPALKDLIPGLEVIAVFGQYSVEDSKKPDPRPTHSLGKTPDLGHGLIILFQFDRSIKYCYTYPFKISSSCTKNPKILINCSKIRVNTTVWEPIEEEVNYLAIISMVFFVLLYAFIVLVIWFYRQNEILGKPPNIEQKIGSEDRSGTTTETSVRSI